MQCESKKFRIFYSNTDTATNNGRITNLNRLDNHYKSDYSKSLNSSDFNSSKINSKNLISKTCDPTKQTSFIDNVVTSPTRLDLLPNTETTNSKSSNSDPSFLKKILNFKFSSTSTSFQHTCLLTPKTIFISDIITLQTPIVKQKSFTTSASSSSMNGFVQHHTTYI